MKRFVIFIFLIFLIGGLAFASSNGDAEFDMTHKMTILMLQLAVIVAFSRIFGMVFSRYLKQPRVLGELVAGMIIGPYALGALRLPVLGQALFPLPGGTMPVTPQLYGFAVLASIILLFIAGLETDLPTFLKFSGVGSAIGLGGVVTAFALGDLSAVFFLPGVDSFMDPAALFLGTLSTATSVGITARILSEKRKMSSPEGVTILAAAVLDDVVGIILLAVVVGIAKVGQTGGNVEWANIGIIAAKAFGFWLVCTVIGILIAPKLTKGLKWFENMDTIAGLAFGLALLLAGLSELAGLAMIIGAYVMGLSLSQTDMAHALMEKLQGVYHFLVPIFFCVMGMMVDFAALPAVFVFGLIYSCIAIAAKLIGCGIPALFLGFNLRGALRIGAGMLPRGEVTLIVAGIGLSAGAINNEIFGVAIMTLLVASIIAPPVLIKSFTGGSGYRRKLAKKEGEQQAQVKLDFPSSQMADFLRQRILAAFRNEEFFVARLDFGQQIHQIRKEDTIITLNQEDGSLVLSMLPKDEQFVRLLVLEEILNLKEFLEGLQQMESPDAMGVDLMAGMFADDSEE